MKNREKTQPSGQRRTKGGKFVPALCNLIGTLILISVIATCLPVTVPRFMGYGIYHVVSGSMAPEIPVGSAIYVKAAEPETIAEEDIIAFESGEVVITHRVVQNKTVEGTFTTKGDANERCAVCGGDRTGDCPFSRAWRVDGSVYKYHRENLCRMLCRLRSHV